MHAHTCHTAHVKFLPSTAQCNSQAPKPPLASHTLSADSAHCEVPPRFGAHTLSLSDHVQSPQTLASGRSDDVIGSSHIASLTRPVVVDCWFAGAAGSLPYRRHRVAVCCLCSHGMLFFPSLDIRFFTFLRILFSPYSFSNSSTLNSRWGHTPSRRAPPPPRCCCRCTLMRLILACLPPLLPPLARCVVSPNLTGFFDNISCRRQVNSPRVSFRVTRDKNTTRPWYIWQTTPPDIVQGQQENTRRLEAGSRKPGRKDRIVQNAAQLRRKAAQLLLWCLFE